MKRIPYPYLVILGDACQAGLISDATVDCSRSLNAIVEHVFINFVFTHFGDKNVLPINLKYVLLIANMS